TDQIQGIAVAPDGRRAVTGSDDASVRLWDLEAGTEECCFSGHIDSVTAVAFSSNNRWVLSGSSDCTARLWDIMSGTEQRRFPSHTNWINAVAFTPDSRRIVTGSGGEMSDGQFQHGNDCTVRIWDI